MRRLALLWGEASDFAYRFLLNPVSAAPLDGSRVPGSRGSFEPFDSHLKIFRDTEALFETPGVEEHSVRISFLRSLLEKVCRNFRAARHPLTIHVKNAKVRQRKRIPLASGFFIIFSRLIEPPDLPKMRSEQIHCARFPECGGFLKKNKRLIDVGWNAFAVVIAFSGQIFPDSIPGICSLQKVLKRFVVVTRLPPI